MRVLGQRGSSRGIKMPRRALLVAPVLLSLAALAPATAATQAGAFETKVINGLDPGEPQLAVDPIHHSIAAAFLLTSPPAGASKCGVATSDDYGKTWKVRFKNPADPVPSQVTACSDPIAASGKGGAMYVGAEWGGLTNDDTYVSRSVDGGKTWGAAAYATGHRDQLKNELAAPNSGNEDRPWLTADSRTGTVYASLGDFAPRLRHWITASHDDARTFGPPRAIAPNYAPEWPSSDFIPAAAYGVLAVSYVSTAVDPDCLCRDVFETSTDDGATWTRHAAPIPAQWVAADPSHKGRFAIMSGGETITDWQSFNSNELLVSVTSDYGKTWSPTAHIGQAPSNPRWMPWIGYAPDGVLGVSYRTKYGNTNCDVPEECNMTGFDMWAAVSADGGFTFSPPVRISHAVSAPEVSGGNGGFEGGADDFGTVALDNKYLYAAWGDMRATPTSSRSGAQRSMYFGRVPLPKPQAPPPH